MYATSEEFHEAIRNGNTQKALLIFKDAVFTDEDISVDRGIEFNDYFNTEEDLAIGQATSNEISFTLFNDDRLLNEYEFGDFTALLGVYLRTETYQQFGVCMMKTNNTPNDYWLGSEEYPFVRRNGVALSSQPSFPVNAMLGYDDKVWVFSDDGRYVVYNDKTGENVTDKNPVNGFMLKKALTWTKRGIYYDPSAKILHEYEAGEEAIYEFCPLGVFTAKRPKAPDMIQIDFTCYDLMQKFDIDMPTPGELGMSYPSTISNLYTKMCRHVKVPYATASFINSGAVIPEVPVDFERVTMRDVMKWIAEAAGSNARFNRDGELTLAWLKETDQSYEATNYSDFNPYWYETPKITKLCNRDLQDNVDHVRGSGKTPYLIQDNPLLKGVS